MPTISKFEDLVIWQHARKQCNAVLELFKSTSLGQDYNLRNQMDRSSASVMDNIAEGFDRFSRADFRHFLVIARGSNAELRSQFYRSEDRNHSIIEQLVELRDNNAHIGVMLTKLIKHLDSSLYNSKPKINGKQLASEDEITYEPSYNLPF